MRFQTVEKVSFTTNRVASFICPPEKAQAFLWSKDVDGLGVRSTPRGDPSYIWQGRFNGQVVRISIGPVNKVDLKKATAKARAFTGDAARQIDPRGEKRAAKEKALADKAAKAKAADDREHSLGRLADAYVQHLFNMGKVSAKDVAGLFKLYLHPHPVAAKPAKDVTTDDALELLRAATNGGKTPRNSDRLRTALKAAFQLAATKQAMSEGLVSFDDFGINHSPMWSIKPIQSSIVADRNPLSVDEMRIYWKALQGVGGIYGAFLRLHILSGGPRLAQLSRLRISDIKDGFFELVERKGRGVVSRPYSLPITPQIKVELDALTMGKSGFLLDNGKGQPIDKSAISDWGDRVPHGIEGFQLKRIRSGVETVLSASGISKEIRGELQSHGVGGVQKRSYDAHHYLNEKTHALNVLYELLNGEITK
jgi:Arm DNA-binding domain